VDVGGHGNDFDLEGAGTSPQTVTIDTQPSGSTILAVTFTDPGIYGAPTDNKGNTYTLVQAQSGYYGGRWAPYGLEVYAKTDAAGGTGHAVSITKSTPTAESTLIVVEATGTTIQSSSIVTRDGAGAGVAYASGSVTTTGPALLVAVWGGDGGVGTADQTATPGAGWTVIDSLFLGFTAYIQAAVAVKLVEDAGTYTCDWTPVENQGAILFLAAIQA
jgi:hypothetical protein